MNELRDAIFNGHRRYGSMEQRAQLVRYLQHCRLYTANEAWQYVDSAGRDKIRLMYRMLRRAQEQGTIVWENGQFVERNKKP